MANGTSSFITLFDSGNTTINTDDPQKVGLPTLGLGASTSCFGNRYKPILHAQAVIDLAGGAPTPEVLLGVVSFIFSTITIVVRRSNITRGHEH